LVSYLLHLLQPTRHNYVLSSARRYEKRGVEGDSGELSHLEIILQFKYHLNMMNILDIMNIIHDILGDKVYVSG